jgi:UPF0755 protein
LNFTYKRTILLSFGLFFLLGLSLLMGLGYSLISPAKKGGSDQIFFVRDGMTFKQVTLALEREELVRSRYPLLLWARVMGAGRGIKAGEYRLNPGMSPLAILAVLSKGAVILHPITLPEGLTKLQIGQLLSERGLVDKERFLSLTEDPEVAARYGIRGATLEGFLFPDTYHFSRGLSPEFILDVLVRRFQEVVPPRIKEGPETGLNLEQIVTLASIVEKETGLAEERPLVASVFLNRLERGMRLGSDPTVIYGIKDFDGRLRRKDLTESTPYNTYVNLGLPPGPIASPGLDSIMAVLYPAKSDYLYFVSKNDGSHYFSKTYAEHNRAVDYYQRKKGPKPKETS